MSHTNTHFYSGNLTSHLFLSVCDQGKLKKELAVKKTRDVAFAQQCGLTLCYIIMCAFSKSAHIRNENELQLHSIKLIMVSSAGFSLSFDCPEALICTPLTT